MKPIEMRSPYDEVGGLVYFGRLLDRVRLYQENRLLAEYLEMYGDGFDERTCDFLQVSFEALSARILEGGGDDEILEWCFVAGRKPSADEIEIWNGFLSKRGWRDPMSTMIREELAAKGWDDRSDIKTLFDFFDADEGRPLRFKD